MKSGGPGLGQALDVDEETRGRLMSLAGDIFGSRGSNHRFRHALSGVITETKRKLRFRPSSALRSAQDAENL